MGSDKASAHGTRARERCMQNNKPNTRRTRKKTVNSYTLRLFNCIEPYCIQMSIAYRVLGHSNGALESYFFLLLTSLIREFKRFGRIRNRKFANFLSSFFFCRLGLGLISSVNWFSYHIRNLCIFKSGLNCVNFHERSQEKETGLWVEEKVLWRGKKMNQKFVLHALIAEKELFCRNRKKKW